jgi:acyl carrier protein
MTESIEFYVGEILRYLQDTVLLDPDEEIPLDESLLEAGILDSYGTVELITFIESQFEISIPDADLTREKLGSVRKMADYVFNAQKTT